MKRGRRYNSDYGNLNRYHSSRHIPAVPKSDFHTLPAIADH